MVEQGLIKVIHSVCFYVLLILFRRPSVDTDCAATPAVATDFSFNHLQRTPGQTPEWHIFGFRPGTGGAGREGGGGGGGGQSHVADVGKQYPPLSWHRRSKRATVEISGGRATHRPGQKVDSHADICIHTRALARTLAGRNTQTNKRLTLSVCHSAAAPVSMATAGTM